MDACQMHIFVDAVKSSFEYIEFFIISSLFCFASLEN